MEKVDTLPPVNCAVCGKLFHRKIVHQKYCSEECKRSADNQRQRNSRRIKHDSRVKICAVCGKTFTPKHNGQKCCSLDCSAIARKQYDANYYRRISHVDAIRICATCGKTFTLQKPRQKYCSDECREIMIRKQQREYQRNKIRKPKPAKKLPHKFSSLNDIIKAANDCGIDYGNYRAFLNLGYTHDQIKKRFGRIAV